jgi:hypothetical protein
MVLYARGAGRTPWLWSPMRTKAATVCRGDEIVRYCQAWACSWDGVPRHRLRFVCTALCAHDGGAVEGGGGAAQCALCARGSSVWATAEFDVCQVCRRNTMPVQAHWSAQMPHLSRYVLQQRGWSLVRGELFYALYKGSDDISMVEWHITRSWVG